MKRFIVTVAALAIMAGSAYAAEWSFYGTAQVFTVWSETDEINGAEGDLQFAEGLYGGANIGAEVKVSDELSGGFEYDSGVNVVNLFGEWDFGVGTLTVGQCGGPIGIAYSNQFVAGVEEDLGLGGFGDFDAAEAAQIMLTFDGFQIAFRSPNDVYGNAEATIPAIHASYAIGFDMGEVVIAGGYATYEVNDEDVDGYGIGVGADLNFGPVGIFGTIVYGQNLAIVGTETATGFGGAAVVGADVEDCDSLGFTIGVKFAVNDMLALEAGYGYIQDEVNDVEDEGQSCYIQAPITLAPGVTITPEVGVIDGMDDGDEETLYYGMGWEIAF